MFSRTPRLFWPVLLGTALIAATAHGAPSASSSAKKGGIAYKWVDEQGVVHYGDNIPPQYASRTARS